MKQMYQIKIKKAAAGILAAELLLADAGCGNDGAWENTQTDEFQSSTQGNTAEVEKKEDTDEIVFASTKDIRDINPHLYSGEMAAQNMVFESLVVTDTDGEIQPCLAESWEISDDQLTYTFHLRQGVTFHDGEPFNAEAVKMNFDAIISNRERHAWMDMVNEIDETLVQDEYTFVLKMKHPYYPTLTELSVTRPFRMISPKCFIDGETKNGVSGYAGTGPWILSEHEKDQYALFARNEAYWGEAAKVSAVRWKVMPDTQTMLLALEKGEIDLIFGADGDQIDLNSFQKLQEEGKYATELSDPVASRAILLNCHQEITGDLKVREALQYAVDKESIVEGILNGSESAADTLMPENAPYCDVELEARTYDPEKAGELLEEAGWELSEKDGIRYKDGDPCEMTIYLNSDNAQEQAISEYLQADFQNVGVKLNIVGEEKQSYLDRQKSGDFDLMYSLSWGTPYDPQSYVSSWRIPAHGDYQAQVGLEKKEWLDETITALMIEGDEEKRAQSYAQILTYIHEQCVYIPLSYSRTKAVHVPSLKGVTFNASQYEIPFEKMYFEE